jgi:GH25 family lysozyme M1 (1,4-beta-N-acetylmuramidase)
MTAIFGFDLSHHQSIDIDWDKLCSTGVGFIYHKLAEGPDILDDCAKINLKAAKEHGLGIGGYFFGTPDSPTKQFENFKRAAGDIDFDLMPAIDCEKNGVTGSIITEAITDAIGMQMAKWMADRPKLAASIWPSIYTNLGYGDLIFKDVRMARYHLWVAQWGVKTPGKPKVWRNEKIYLWQNEVSDGVAHGLRRGAIDHDVWMDKFPFPGTTSIPSRPLAPPVVLENPITLMLDGKTYTGTVKENVL